MASLKTNTLRRPNYSGNPRTPEISVEIDDIFGAKMHPFLEEKGFLGFISRTRPKRDLSMAVYDSVPGKPVLM
jgi:hypothetical protein